MAKQSKESSSGSGAGLLDDLPLDELKEQARDFVAAMGKRALTAATGKVGGLASRLVDYAEGSGGDGSGGSGGSQGDKSKLTNILEQIEVGVPVHVAYNQWTQFEEFPKFTKRVESVDQKSDEEVTWKAGIYFSHRTWRSTIIEQVPDERIVWHSEGDKGYVDGTVTFHEITPDLTKILVVLEYHAQGLFERTGNMFRVQRRRARLELQHFARHVMTQTILDQDVEGWRGEIRDSDVVRSDEEGRQDDENEEYEDEDESYDEDEPEDEYDDENEPEDEYDDEDEPEDEYDDEDDDEAGPDDEAEDDEPEPEEEPEEDEDAADDEPDHARTTRRGRRQPARSR